MNSTKLCKTYMYSIFYFLIFVNLVNCFSYEVTYTGDNFWIKRSVRPLADEYFSFYLNNIYSIYNIYIISSTKTHYRADFCGVFAVFFTCVLMLLFIKLYILTRSEIFYLLRTIVGILLHIIIWSLVFIGFGGWMFLYRFSFCYFKIFFVESKVKIQVSHNTVPLRSFTDNLHFISIVWVDRQNEIVWLYYIIYRFCSMTVSVSL